MNSFNDIKVPDNIKEYTRNCIAEGRKINNKKKCKKIMIASFSALTIFSGAIGISIKNPSFAEKIPVLNDMMYLIQGALQNGSLNDSVTEVNKYFSSDGLTFNVDKSWYDGNQIYIDLTIKSEEPFENTKYINSLDIIGDTENEVEKYLSLHEWKLKVNGEEIENYGFESMRVRFIDEYTLKGKLLIDFIPISDESNDTTNINFDFKLSQLDEEKNTKKVFDGKWSLNFDVKSNDKIFKRVKINDTTNGVTLKNIRITQTSLNLDLTSSKGNPIGHVEVKDNNGNTLSSGMGVSNGDNYEGISYLNSIGEIPKSIIITVYGIGDNNKKPIADFKVDL